MDGWMMDAMDGCYCNATWPCACDGCDGWMDPMPCDSDMLCDSDSDMVSTCDSDILGGDSDILGGDSDILGGDSDILGGDSDILGVDSDILEGINIRQRHLRGHHYAK